MHIILIHCGEFFIIKVPPSLVVSGFMMYGIFASVR